MILSKPYINDPRVTKEAKTLTENGHKVQVIVWDRKNKYEKDDIIDNVKLHRIHNNF